MRNPRTVLAGVVALVVLCVAIIIIVTGDSGGARSAKAPVRTARAKLTLERAAPPETPSLELVVSLPDERLNTRDTTGGKASVLLTCLDEGGRRLFRVRHPWPLVEEYGYPPHIHQPAAADVLDRLRSCRLTATGIDFAGRAPGRLPRLKPPS